MEVLGVNFPWGVVVAAALGGGEPIEAFFLPARPNSVTLPLPLGLFPNILKFLEVRGVKGEREGET